MNCQNCGSENVEENSFCQMCGFVLPRLEEFQEDSVYCIECGEQIGAYFVFCDQCGADQSANESLDFDNTPISDETPEEDEERLEEPSSPIVNIPNPTVDEHPEDTPNAPSNDDQIISETQESKISKRKVFPLVAVIAAVIAASLGFMLGGTQIFDDSSRETREVASDKGTSSSLSEEDPNSAEREDSLEADSGEANAGSNSNENDTDGEEAVLKPENDTDGLAPSESANSESLGFESWAQTLMVESSGAKVLISSQCPADYCSVQTISLKYEKPSQHNLDTIPALATFISQQNINVQSSKLELSSMSGSQRVDLVLGFTGREEGYVPINRVDLEFETLSGEVISKSIVSSALDFSTFADEVTQPIQSYVSDYERTIPTLGPTQEKLVAAGLCESFGEMDNSGRLPCRHSSMAPSFPPNNIGLLAATGPTVNSWKKYGSRSKNDELVVLGQGWAFTFFANDATKYLENFRQMGALYFISSELSCDLNVAGPNELKACITF